MILILKNAKSYVGGYYLATGHPKMVNACDPYVIHVLLIFMN